MYLICFQDIHHAQDQRQQLTRVLGAEQVYQKIGSELVPGSLQALPVM